MSTPRADFFPGGARLGRRLLWVFLVGAIVVAAGCGSSAEGGGTPGLRDVERPLDTSPFELAGPTNGGSTTIPDLPGADELAPTTSTTTTTTTQPPFFLPEDVTSLCGFTRSIRSLFPPEPVPSENITFVLEGLNRNLGAYVELAPDEVREDVIVIRTLVFELTALFEEGGKNSEHPPLVARIARLQAGEPPDDQVVDALTRVAIYEDDNC